MYGRAAVLEQPGQDVMVREFPVPEPEPGAVLVRLTQCNICGSDVHAWRGDFQLKELGGELPTVLGHEMTGEAFRLGSGVATDSLGQPLAPGDRLVFPYFTFCGRCPSCTNGYPIGCRHLRMAMLSSANRFPYFVGGFADYFYLPPAHPIIKIPRDLPETVVAGANCALAQICYGFHRAGLVGGKSLVVQGAGGLGLYATALANARGLAPIIVIDAVTSRLELARAFGADIVINLRETTPTERRRLVGEATGGLGADFVVDVTGNPAAIPEGLGMLRVGGKFLEIGSINRGQTVPLDPSRIVFGNKTVMGVSLYELFALVEAVQFLIRYGSRYPFEEMTATTFPLERVNEALQLADGRGAPRVALRMR